MPTEVYPVQPKPPSDVELWSALRDEAQQHSSGRFSLDWQKAQSGYAVQARAGMGLYLCKAFQAGVATDPERLDWRSSGATLSQTWRGGAPLAEEQIEQIRDALFSGTTPHELSRAAGHLLWCLRFVPEGVQVQIKTGGVLLHLTEQGPRLARIPPQQETEVGFLRGKVPWKQILDVNWLRLKAGIKWPEMAWFLERASHSPVPLYINGRRWSFPPHWEWPQPNELLATLVDIPLTPANGILGVAVTERSCNSSFRYGAALVDEIPRHCLRGDRLACQHSLHLTLNEGHGSDHDPDAVTYRSDRLLLVSDGVLLGCPRAWLGKFGFALARAAPHLPTDLTTLTLVDGAELARFLADCDRLAEDFLLMLEASAPSYQPPGIFVPERGLPLGKYLPSRLERWRSGDWRVVG